MWVFFLYSYFIYVLKVIYKLSTGTIYVQKSSMQARTAIMGPNDARRIILAMSKCFLLLFVLFISTNHLTSINDILRLWRGERAQMMCFTLFGPLVSVFLLLLLITLQRCVRFVCTPTLAPWAWDACASHALGPNDGLPSFGPNMYYFKYIFYLVVFIFIASNIIYSIKYKCNKLNINNLIYNISS